MFFVSSRVHFYLPSFPPAILNYVSVRSLSPLYFLYCAVAQDSVSNSGHAGTLWIPLAPLIFIPASLPVDIVEFMLESGFKGIYQG